MILLLSCENRNYKHLSISARTFYLTVMTLDNDPKNGNSDT